MNKHNQKQYWKITGYDGLSTLFEHKIYAGQISEKKLKELLKALTSKISLSEEEIISSYANKGTKIYFNHLEVQSLEGKRYMYSCGTNPYVTAVIEYESN